MDIRSSGNITNSFIPVQSPPQKKNNVNSIVNKDSVVLNDKNSFHDKSHELNKAASVMLQSRADRLKPLWTFKAPAENNSLTGAYISKDGGFYTTSDDGIYCLDSRTGKLLWKNCDTGSFLTTTPVIERNDGKLCSITIDRRMFMIDPKDGSTLSKEEFYLNRCEPHFTPDGSFYLTEADKIGGVKPDGTETFNLSLKGGSASVETLDAVGNALVSNDKGITSISPKGEINWGCSGDDADFFPTAPSKVFTSSDKTIIARDSATGKKIWQNRGDYPRPVSADDNHTVVNFDDVELKSFDTSTGNTLWERKFEDTAEFYPGGSDGSILVSDYDNIKMLDPKTGKTRWEMDYPNTRRKEVKHSFVNDKGILYFSSDQKVFGIDTQTGKVINEFTTQDDIQELRHDNRGSLYIMEGLQLTAYDTRSLEERIESKINEETSPPEPEKKLVVEDNFVDIGGVKLEIRNRTEEI